MEFKNSGTEIFRIDLDEIRKLREEVEALRRDVAQLNGRLDVIEDLIPIPEIQSDAEAIAEIEALQRQHAELKAMSVRRRLADD